jgi:hypothetical protein
MNRTYRYMIIFINMSSIMPLMNRNLITFVTISIAAMFGVVGAPGSFFPPSVLAQVNETAPPQELQQLNETKTPPEQVDLSVLLQDRLSKLNEDLKSRNIESALNTVRQLELQLQLFTGNQTSLERPQEPIMPASFQANSEGGQYQSALFQENSEGGQYQSIAICRYYYWDWDDLWLVWRAYYIDYVC